MNSDELNKELDKWIPYITKFIISIFLIVFILQIGIWHGRKLERQEISATNEMWNEIVACFKIKEMHQEHINYQRQKIILESK